MKSSTASILFIAISALQGAATAFMVSPSTPMIKSCSRSGIVAPHETLTALAMGKDEDLKRAEKSKRFADVDDNLVELKRPLGIVLDQDEQGYVVGLSCCVVSRDITAFA
jgi:hypothetical protein